METAVLREFAMEESADSPHSDFEVEWVDKEVVGRRCRIHETEGRNLNETRSRNPDPYGDS